MVLRPQHQKVIELLTRTRLTLKEIAKKARVSERTVLRWVHHREEFRRALKAHQEAERFRAEHQYEYGVRALTAQVVDRIHGGVQGSYVVDVIDQLVKLDRLLERTAQRRKDDAEED